MPKLNTTDRKLLAKEIVKRISQGVNNDNDEKKVKQYLKESKQEKLFSEIVKVEDEIKELIRTRQSLIDQIVFPRSIHRQPTTFGDLQYLLKFSTRVELPEVSDIETDILLEDNDDIKALIESIVKKYTEE
jgi:hypothetical protein